MKVIINRCYGGFCLSSEAIKRAVKEGAAGVIATPLERWSREAHPEKEFKKDVGEGFFSHLFMEDALLKEGLVYTHEDHDPRYRADPVLVRIVEEMGKAASGSLGELKVVEIPDGTDFVISEYDGFEHIAESHRTWG